MKKSVLVVAHPDDEILWFSSVLDKISKIIIVFQGTDDMKISSGRNDILNSNILPYSNKIVSLGMSEANVFNKANWQMPETTNYGIKVNSLKYEDNYDKIKDKLFKELEGFEDVITHNPWGEYGHEEHVQVFKAILKISKKLNFSIWISSYFSEQSYKIMSLFKNFVSKDFQNLKINSELCEKVKSIYISNEAWTWSNNYKWPQNESFFKLKTNFFDQDIGVIETPHVWDQMNFILMYHINMTLIDRIRSKIIKILGLILPNYFFKLLVKIKNKFYAKNF